ncbi:D-glycero-beta-D-manno-heptose 1-phosphate adenylyltransferase [Lentimicrobium sp.]|jgi:rfaE bifunctional protein nucleotidyltransferase chain/domain|uniref:D-glycero-beta-D-manno-heptose 1-phosphate adenylyltransferase n=1 Tax=Lentimicrobium sp. TaxID=2034841 RepID=UPI0025D0F99E|nr:D-glycero-beta-D-manno-heptose 1-phosphate adenylyltransferase [Lentimicrobium sp.]MCO5256951.1 D-glycero-beta-D-manno-heptose 1-phosphate adenylyltransferase [Lentimicrobium sp.]MCO5261915.1 D-glycero-beta-D-manno-heptose 1-phosphate adenylyltransferase [Lentimicrobium sp.]HOP13143.1 D-glycero-beta-D-manno-heptose 1-phosphate adenylyltransferase [Lentimicrobium sp.]HPF65415.1 D-glycero-beta-D-manno-heptose 1-phosphate adenylyltransferase [Lentimicrobium sp.]HPJ63648.1 D-glycero-beta-D-mann
MTKPELIQRKILKQPELDRMLAYWRFRDQKIVFTNGCFDIIHLGHIDYLAKAAALGDKLIIGLNTDASTRRLKGPHRPINDENARAMIMASFSFVDAVVLFDEDTPYNLIRTVQPDILVKGADYRAEDIVGYDIVTSKGGKVETLEYLPGYSTSLIEKKIRDRE